MRRILTTECCLESEIWKKRRKKNQKMVLCYPRKFKRAPT